MDIYNLADNRELFFTSNNPLYAVCFAYAEDHNLKSRWSSLVHADATIDRFKDAGFPVITSDKSIACGNWAGLVAVQ